MSEREHFSHTCPLCLDMVDATQPTCYRVLPLDAEYAGIVNETPQWRPKVTFSLENTSVGNSIFRQSNYPNDRSTWLLHTRCLDLVRGIAMPELYFLIRLVEPTFFSEACEPASQHGAFYSAQEFPTSKPKRVRFVECTIPVIEHRYPRLQVRISDVTGRFNAVF